MTAPDRKLRLSAQQELDACHPLVIEQAVTDLSCGTRLGVNHPFRASSMIRSQVIERIGAILSRRRRPAMSDRQISNLREVYERCAIEDITGAGNLISEETRRAIFDRVAEVQAPAFDEPAGECRKSAESTTKPRLELVPYECVEEIAEVLAFGAEKYEANNWTRGARWGRYFAALLRHLFAWWRGEDLDKETGKSHLAHAGCCLFFLMAYQRHGWGSDDRFLGPDEKPFTKHDGAA